MHPSTFPTLIILLKAGGLIVGFLVLAALIGLAAALAEQAFLGRDIDDAGGGK